MSPKAWKTSFSEFHRNYSPRGSQRNSFRSSDKSRYGSLSRESSTLGVSSKTSPMENPLSESRELDAASSHGEGEDASAVETSGNERKSEEDSSRAEGEKGLKETEEEKKDGEKAPPSESSSELNGSCDSVSLELQLSAAHSGPLHIEEDDSTVTPDPAKPNGLVSGLNSDPKDPSTPHKVGFVMSTQLKLYNSY